MDHYELLSCKMYLSNSPFSLRLLNKLINVISFCVFLDYGMPSSYIDVPSGYYYQGDSMDDEGNNLVNTVGSSAHCSALCHLANSGRCVAFR